MAHLKPGSAGEFNGKIGDVVIYRWGKKTVGRSTPRKARNKVTKLQRDQRSVFGFTSNLLSPFNEAINIGFASKKGTMTAMNTAVKYNLKHAVSGTYPNLTTDYAKIQLSKGYLDHVHTPSLTKIEDNKVRIEWLNPVNLKLGVEENDIVHLCFYSETTRRTIEFENAAFRSDGYTELTLGQRRINGTIRVWMFMIAANGKTVSNSKYLGTFELDKLK